MAKASNNILLQGLTGSLGGQLVLRRGRRGQTIVSAKPVFGPDRQFSAAQKAHQQAFREASAYARVASDDAFYRLKSQQRDQSAYNAAIADWFHPPQIVEVDVTHWSGQAGETIRVKAVDDTQVIQVSLVITDESGQVLEQGTADPGDGFWWSYVTTAQANGKRCLQVTAQDRPGNQAQHTWLSHG
ncbi:MAG TPA: hypothetical protein VJ821_04100 [Anaerolineales bacterium]|nr:hypothetical protein [Anaerolineales bacterium]